MREFRQDSWSKLQAIETDRVDDTECAQALAIRRWGDSGFRCDHCGHDSGVQITGRPRVFQCRSCFRQRSVTAGTVLHKTTIPLYDWVVIAASVQLGWISMRAVARLLGRSYDTVFRICHKIRCAMHAEPSPADFQDGFLSCPFRASRRRLPNEKPLPMWYTRPKFTCTRLVRSLGSRDQLTFAVALDRHLPGPADRDPDVLTPPLPSQPSDFLAHYTPDGAPVEHAESCFDEWWFSTTMNCHHQATRKYLRHYLDAYFWRYMRRGVEAIELLLRMPHWTFGQLEPSIRAG